MHRPVSKEINEP